MYNFNKMDLWIRKDYENIAKSLLDEDENNMNERSQQQKN